MRQNSGTGNAYKLSQCEQEATWRERVIVVMKMSLNRHRTTEKCVYTGTAEDDVRYSS